MTTRIFLTTLFSLTLLLTSQALTSDPTPEDKTTFILLPLFESTDKTNDEDNRYADMLAELFKSKSIANIYTNGNDEFNTKLNPLANKHALKLQQFSEASLSKSLFDIYTNNTGETIVLAADAKTLAKVMNMLSGRDEYIRIRSNDRFKVYQVESTQIGKGNIRSFDFTQQVKATM